MDEKQPEGLAEVKKALQENRALTLLTSQVEALRNTVLGEINVLDRALTDLAQRLEALETGGEGQEALENAVADISGGVPEAIPVPLAALPQPAVPSAMPAPDRAMLCNLVTHSRFKSLKRTPEGSWKILIWKTSDWKENIDKPEQIVAPDLNDAVHKSWKFMGGGRN